jgi:hypothetical protein
VDSITDYVVWGVRIQRASDEGNCTFRISVTDTGNVEGFFPKTIINFVENADSFLTTWMATWTTWFGISETIWNVHLRTTLCKLLSHSSFIIAVEFQFEGAELELVYLV